MRALDEFVKALELCPNDPASLAALQKVKYSVN
jgi:hypothetical protein